MDPGVKAYTINFCSPLQKGLTLPFYRPALSPPEATGRQVEESPDSIEQLTGEMPGVSLADHSQHHRK